MNIKSIQSIIKEPVHCTKFYTKETLKDLVCTLKQIYRELEKAISIIQNFIKSNVKLITSYFDAFCERTDKFDNNELIYRTAYGELVMSEVMCAVCVEAVRMLLAMYEIKSYTLLAKLPGKIKDCYIMSLSLNIIKIKKQSMQY